VIVGTVRELKSGEFRVGLTPDGVRDLTLRPGRILREFSA